MGDGCRVSQGGGEGEGDDRVAGAGDERKMDAAVTRALVLADRRGRVKGSHRSLKICGGRREKASLASALWRYLREKPSKRAKQALRFKLRCHPSTLR